MVTVDLLAQLKDVQTAMHALVEKITYEGATREDEKNALSLIIQREDVLVQIKQVKQEA